MDSSTAYAYDNADRLTSLVHRKGTDTIASLAYAYDKVGNRTKMTEQDGDHNYTYDALYQLIRATHPQPANPTETFTYDPVGNRITSHLSSSYIYDAGNRLLEDDSFSYSYDDNGNLIQRQDKGSGEVTKYSYDYEDRLIKIEVFPSASSPNPTSTSTYRYDGFGRRIEKNVDGVVTCYLYDGEDILYELDDSNTILARYTHGPGIDEPLIMEREGVNYYYHEDGLGGITHLTDADGAIAQSYVYDSFGNIIAQSGTVANPYTYTAREYDPESGLYYYRARYYDANIGRFLQTDPIGFASGDVNLYRYVRNNPINFLDPMGLFACTFFGGVNPNKAPATPNEGAAAWYQREKRGEKKGTSLLIIFFYAILTLSYFDI